MAEAAKLEISTRDAILAIGFVGLVILGIALVQAGYITNPLSLGLMVTLSIGLILVGHILVKAGVFSPSALLLWYVFAFGLVMAVYGRNCVRIHTCGLLGRWGLCQRNCNNQRNVLCAGGSCCSCGNRSRICLLSVLQEEGTRSIVPLPKAPE